MTDPSKTIQKAKASVEKRAGTAGRWTRTQAGFCKIYNKNGSCGANGNEIRYHFTIFKAGGFLNG